MGISSYCQVMKETQPSWRPMTTNWRLRNFGSRKLLKRCSTQSRLRLVNRLSCLPHCLKISQTHCQESSCSTKVMWPALDPQGNCSIETDSYCSNHTWERRQLRQRFLRLCKQDSKLDSPTSLWVSTSSRYSPWKSVWSWLRPTSANSLRSVPLEAISRGKGILLCKWGKWQYEVRWARL